MKNILLISPHAGGGVGSVLMDWVDRDIKSHYTVALLDYANGKIKAWAHTSRHLVYGNLADNPLVLSECIDRADIVVLNHWDHPLLTKFMQAVWPKCRMVSWLHKNYPVSQEEINYPDIFIDTSPIQKHGRCIWSCRNMERFFEIKPKAHQGFNIGYIGTVDFKKVHSHFLLMLHKIGLALPGAYFTIVGEDRISDNIRRPWVLDKERYTFTGKVDDVAPYLAELDCFFYPLRPDHYGTCEQALGEAMSAGLVPVVMDNKAEKIIVGDSLDACKDEEECVKAITFLASHTLAREHLSDVSRSRARQLYDIDRMIREWNMVFEEMMEQPKKERKGL